MTGAAAQVTSAILTVLIMFGATARLTRLITEDTITGPLRARMMYVARRDKRGPQAFAYLWITCPWCVGLWIAFAVCLAVWGGERLLLDHALLPVPAWLWVPGLALTNNHLAARWQTS